MNNKWKNEIEQNNTLKLQLKSRIQFFFYLNIYWGFLHLKYCQYCRLRGASLRGCLGGANPGGCTCTPAPLLYGPSRAISKEKLSLYSYFIILCKNNFDTRLFRSIPFAIYIFIIFLLISLYWDPSKENLLK